jgi:hypothetical protein
VKALLSLLVSVAIALGGALPGRTLHDCAMTGKRGQPACCCKARGACPSCAACEPGAGGAAVSGRTGPGAGGADIRAACCTVTHEKNALRHARPAAEGSWKPFLEGARLAALPPWTAALPAPASGRAPRRPPPVALPGTWGPSLAILHCSLLL